MKKFIMLILTAVMATGLIACSKNGDSQQTTEKKAIINAPSVTDGTLGSILWNTFVDEVTKNADIAPLDLANILIGKVDVSFPSVRAVEPGTVMGFESEITGFESAALYTSDMRPSAFAGYVFKLNDNADVNAFIKMLNDNCNPGWNICTWADCVHSGSYNNMVFFLMYKSSYDKAE